MTTMRPYHRSLLAGFLFLFLAAGVPLAAAGDRAPTELGAGDLGVLATADPAGGMRIAWSPPDGPWPAGGYRVERVVGRRAELVADGLLPGVDEEALSRLDDSSRQGIARAAEALARGETDDLGTGILLLQAMRSFDFARALGIACVDPAPPAGKEFRYRVTALDANGKKIARGETIRLRAGFEAPLPPTPTGLAVSASPAGITVRWKNRLPAEEGQAPAVLFLVLRRVAGAQDAEIVGGGPALLRGPAEGMVLDADPPVATTIRYSVAPLDPFGRRGPESEAVETWSPDWAATEPPAEITVEAKPGAVRVAWRADANPHRKGWIVGRGLTAQGPFEPLVQDPVTEPAFVDDTGRPGTVYWYAVRSVEERDLSGEWAVSPAVRFRRKAPLPPPVDLAATIGDGRVTLKWRPGGKEKLAGWIVQRAAGKGGKFLPLHKGIHPSNRYVDHYPPGLGGVFRYRVIAVGPAGDRSEPSAVVEVPLPDTRPPAAPRIVRADALGGGVHLAWEPGARDPGLAGWLVLRSPVRRALGEVLTEKPLPPETTEYHDTTAPAGEVRWYRVVALDAAGNRSEPAGPVAVRATAMPLPTPPAPGVKLAVSPRRAAVLRFDPPGRPDVRWAVQRKVGDGPWVRVSGPLPQDVETFRDDRLPPVGAKVAYRLVALGTDGTPGPAGPEVALPE